jgi:hypothetical protein
LLEYAAACMPVSLGLRLGVDGNGPDFVTDLPRNRDVNLLVRFRVDLELFQRHV